MAASAVWLIQYQTQWAQTWRWGLYKPYGTWQPCYMYCTSQGGPGRMHIAW